MTALENPETTTNISLDEPPMYKVILHNDDYTHVDFVVMVLQNVFNKSISDAKALMLQIHKSDKGIAGIYTKQIATTKVKEVEQLNLAWNQSLRTSIEKN
ncbi:MAG: ATP-dependent Clp protease adaptor ClpS [Candidimonas sp.]